MTTAAATGIKKAGADLNTIFEGRTTTAIANTGIKKAGVDIATIFEDIASGTGALTTGIKKAGADLNTLFAKIGTVVAGPTVSPRADGDTNLIIDVGTVVCWQGCDFETNGNEYENSPGDLQENLTTWLDSGSASDVWVEFVRTAGTATRWDSHASATRFQLNANQRFSLSALSTSGTTVKDVTGYFRMWDAATGGTAIWTGSTVLWRATATVQTGPCSEC